MAKKKEEAFDLGDLVVDKISKIVGVCGGRSVSITGNVRYDVQPQSKDGRTLETAVLVDEQCIALKEKGVIAVTPPHDNDIEPGDKVEDITCGFKGVVTTITTFTNGCVYAAVQGPVDKENKVPKPHFVSTRILKKVGTLKDTIKPASTGGPLQRSPTRSR